MKIAFLSLPPIKRLERLRRLMQTFARNAKVMNAPFWILAYGSSSYGFNSKNRQGKFDDLDLFIVIPRSTGSEEIIQTASKVFLTKLEASPAHLQAVLDGQYEICRMYGQVDGIKMGFRVICQDVFLRVCTLNGSNDNVRNISTLGQTHVITDKEWNFRSRKYVPVIYRHGYHEVGGGNVVMIEHYCFSRKKHRLGTLGRKFLTGSVVYECEARELSSGIQNLWKVFAAHSRKFRPNLTPFQMVNSILRSDRFSPEFVDRLCRMVQ